MGGGGGLGVSGLASGTVTVVSYLLLLFSQSSCFTIQIGAQGWCTTLALGILVFRYFVEMLVRSVNGVHIQYEPQELHRGGEKGCHGWWPVRQHARQKPDPTIPQNL